MIVDTSALMAILLNEHEGRPFNVAIAFADDPRMSAATLLELTITATRRPNPFAPAVIDAIIDNLRITIEPVTVEQAEIARRAFLTYGRGRHPAALNYGDCFAYALAHATSRPLLFKGNDFAQTDILCAVAM